MFVIKLEARKADEKLKKMLARVDDLTPAMQEALDLTYESVLEEFEGSYYITPSGAKIPWKPRKRTPKPAGKGKILWNRGRLKTAMTGGAGSTKKVSKRSFSYGIDASARFPGEKKRGVTYGQIVAVHRGGLGKVPDAGQVSGRNVPARPFAAMNAPLRARIAVAIKSYILSLPRKRRRAK